MVLSDALSDLNNVATLWKEYIGWVNHEDKLHSQRTVLLRAFMLYDNTHTEFNLII